MLERMQVNNKEECFIIIKTAYGILKIMKRQGSSIQLKMKQKE